MKDEVLNHPMFSGQLESEEDYANCEKLLNEAGVQYPSFVTFETPKKKHVIFFDGAQFHAPPEVEGYWDSLEELYDHIEREIGDDADFDESVFKSDQVKDNIGGMLFLNKTPGATGLRARTSRLIMSPVDHRALAVNQYYQWLKSAKAWLENQDDFLSAYSFLVGHPAFWTRQSKDHPNDWNTDHGVSTMWTYPTSKGGKVLWMMETGGAVRPDFLHRYHDLRLDVYAKSYEKAIVKTAKKVHKFFGLDGEERSGVEYEKSALEKELGQRMSEMGLDKEDDEL